MSYEKVYLKLPVLIQSVLLNLKALLNSRRRYTKEYHNYLNEYIELWSKDVSVLKAYQKDKLRELLLECFDYSSFYNSKMKNLGISKTDIIENPIEILARMPLLSKEDRRKYAEEIKNNKPLRKLVETAYTSGTSGSPTVNFQDSETVERGFALWSRFHYTLGIEKGDRSIRFSGRLIVNPKKKKKPFWIHNYVENQLFMSSYHLKEENIPAYIAKVNSFNPAYLDGYPSAFYVIAKYSLKHNLPITIKAKAITTTAETLYDYQRVIIEKAFQCQVYNQYASSEGAPLIADCSHQRLHIHLDSGIFECLDNNDLPAKVGEIGRLVVTSFRNLKTPLLRYDIKDNVLLSKEQLPCPCGNTWPYVEKIIGREDDMLWTEGKGYVGRMDTAYKGLKGIVLSQIIQNSPREFIVKNVVDQEFSAQEEKKFMQNLKDRLGENCNFVIETVDEIPLGANGKFHAVVRNFEIK